MEIYNKIKFTELHKKEAYLMLLFIAIEKFKFFCPLTYSLFIITSILKNFHGVSSTGG